MNDEQKDKHWLLQQFENNLFAVLVGGVMIWSTFQNNDAKTHDQLTDMNETLTDVKLDLQTFRRQQICNVRVIDKIADKTGVAPPCSLMTE